MVVLSDCTEWSEFWPFQGWSCSVAAQDTYLSQHLYLSVTLWLDSISSHGFGRTAQPERAAKMSKIVPTLWWVSTWLAQSHLWVSNRSKTWLGNSDSRAPAAQRSTTQSPNWQLFDNSPLTRSFPSSPTHDTDDRESSLSLELAELWKIKLQENDFH